MSYSWTSCTVFCREGVIHGHLVLYFVVRELFMDISASCIVFCGERVIDSWTSWNCILWRVIHGHLVLYFVESYSWASWIYVVESYSWTSLYCIFGERELFVEILYCVGRVLCVFCLMRMPSK